MGSLLDILQGHQPEELSREPASVVDPMFDILLELASESESSSSDQVFSLTKSQCIYNFYVLLKTFKSTFLLL